MTAAAETPDEVFKLSRRYRGIPSQLVGTDRVLERWAVSVGDGSTDMRWHELAKCLIPPLDDATAIVVDQLVCRAGQERKRLVELWYRSSDPIREIAKELHMRYDLVTERWLLALVYFRGLFLESPLHSLRKLAATDPTTGRINLAIDGSSEV